MTEIRDRVPLIITRGDYERWLMRPYPVEPMHVADLDVDEPSRRTTTPRFSRRSSYLLRDRMSAMELIRPIMDIAESTRMT